jgi:hypothetical protein
VVSPSIILRTEEIKAHAIKRIQAIKADQENPLAIWIGPYKKIRSLEQNALYWKLVGLVVSATGHSKHTLHSFFKREAFGVLVESVGGKEIEVVPSSSRVSRGDFSELIEHVQRFIAEHGIEEQI